MEEFGDMLPDDEQQLKSLPGIGPNTAAAVLVFAFNRPVALIETSIRGVFIHCFFGDRTGIPDAELRPLTMETLDREDSR